MILVTLGSQKFQFNRLLKEIDRLVKENKVNDSILAQIGYSDYIPQNYSYTDFINRNEFEEKISKSDIVITHGGIGSIITALNHNKKVIAIPRLKKYNEHIDDHQIQIVKKFGDAGIIKVVYNTEDLEIALKEINNIDLKKYQSNTNNNIITDIDNFITKNSKN